ncbi:MAG: NAD(P)/FAD-dependent oxidoreductase [Patescibacteria group bacterium]|jgi:hypothetical protein|nr:NAD(P)/FAD-dependent oxidoreductase [Patescibacteria group bacterium]
MKYDLAVIGAGPAGMMAAGRAGEFNANVVLIEKNKTLGNKLLITGKGRCNFTNKRDDLKQMIEKFGKNGKFLFSCFYKFGPDETIDFFEKRGVKIKIERGGRVFPLSDKSKDVLDALIGYLKESKVKIMTGQAVKDVIKKKNKIEKIILNNLREIVAKQYIICTGGKSYPSTGSTGDGYQWLKNIGHTITRLSPALVPVITQEQFIKDIEGLSLKNVKISLWQNNREIGSAFGEAIFTHNGLSGPIILDLSRKIIDQSNIEIKIDFKPALNFIDLDKRIQKDFKKTNNKMFKNSLNELLPQRLIPVIIAISKIEPEKKVNLITREERKKIIHLLKEFVLKVKRLDGYDKAIITVGGIDLREINPQTMKSRLIDNLYLAGEILDLDGPTGGYNLQACFSTGYIAGENASKF